jgi:hypothetical protein
MADPGKSDGFEKQPSVKRCFDGVFDGVQQQKTARLTHWRFLD